jgi:hypothetical protein
MTRCAQISSTILSSSTNTDLWYAFLTDLVQLPYEKLDNFGHAIVLTNIDWLLLILHYSAQPRAPLKQETVRP